MTTFFTFFRSLIHLVLAASITLGAPIATAQTPVETRMKSFLSVLDKRDTKQLSIFFHPTKKIKFLSFDVGSGELLGKAEYTRSEITAQLKNHKSFAHHHFFDEPNGQTFRADWSSDTKLRMSPLGTFRSLYAPDTFKTYIRWEKLENSWFIVELGESLS